MENLVSSLSSSRRRNTWTVPLMGVGTGGCGAPQHMTIIWTKSGVSVRVSFGFQVIKMKKKIPNHCWLYLKMKVYVGNLMLSFGVNAYKEHQEILMVSSGFTDLFLPACPLSGGAVTAEAAGGGGRAAVSKSPAHAEYHHQEEPEERVSFSFLGY